MSHSEPGGQNLGEPEYRFGSVCGPGFFKDLTLVQCGLRLGGSPNTLKHQSFLRELLYPFLLIIQQIILQTE